LYLATLLPLQSVHADEGMWTLFDLPSAIYDQIAAERLPAAL
jgi:hypothetical protein